MRCLVNVLHVLTAGPFTRDFSNFVDLPSQRLQATRPQPSFEDTHPECAVGRLQCNVAIEPVRFK